MHLILAAAFIFSILILIILFKINDSIIKKRKMPKEKRYKFIKNRLLINIMISCAIFVLISWVVPSLVWHLGAKETNNIERVEMNRRVYALSEADSSMYVGLTTVKGKQKYVFRYERQLNLEPEIVDIKKVEIIEIDATTKIKDPTYEKIAEYKRTRLKDKGTLIASVNDMYSEIDSVTNIKTNTKNWQEKIISEKVRLYIPKDSIKKDYKLK